jgi:hypothetical protein
MFKELNLTNNFLFSIVFLSFTLATALLMQITFVVLNDASLFIVPFFIILGIITVTLSASLFSKGKIWSKVIAVLIILVVLFFAYMGIVDFIEML